MENIHDVMKLVSDNQIKKMEMFLAATKNNSESRGTIFDTYKSVVPTLLAVAAEKWRSKNCPDQKMSKELLHNDSFEDYVFSTALKDFFVFWGDSDGGEGFCQYLDNYSDTVITAHETVFRGLEQEELEENKDNTNDSESEKKEPTFLETAKDFSEGEDYGKRCLLMEEAFIRDVCRMISPQNSCLTDEDFAETEAGVPLVFDLELFNSEYKRVWHDMIAVSTQSAEDCISVLRALKKEIPLDGSIQQKAIEALNNWLNPFAFRDEVRAHVYKRLAELLG